MYEIREKIYNYLKQNSKELSKEQKKRLIYYVTSLSKHNVENVKTENIESIIADLKYLNEIIKNIGNTGINKRRILKINDISTEVINYLINGSTEDIQKISAQLDDIYRDLDLPPRSTIGIPLDFLGGIKK